MKNNICLAFDFGHQYIGVAIGQSITLKSSRLMTLKTKNKQQCWEQIKKIFEDWNPTIAIVGLPINMNGNEQLITKKTRKFAQKLKNFFKITVILHDERFSTLEAYSNIKNDFFCNKNKKNIIHAESAAIILDSWMQKHFQ